jgi:hypothetical protein
MAMGQAAGAAAALSVRLETTPGQVSVTALHELLIQHGAIVPSLDMKKLGDKAIRKNK